MPKPPRGEGMLPEEPKSRRVTKEEPPTVEFDPAALETARGLIGDEADTNTDPTVSQDRAIAGSDTDLSRRLRDAVLADGAHEAETRLDIEVPAGSSGSVPPRGGTAWGRSPTFAPPTREATGYGALELSGELQEKESAYEGTQVMRRKRSERETEVKFNVVGYSRFLEKFRGEYGAVSEGMQLIALNDTRQFDVMAKRFPREFLDLYRRNLITEQHFPLPSEKRYEAEKADAEKTFGPFILAYEQIQAARQDLENRYDGYGFRSKEEANRYWADALTIKMGGTVLMKGYDVHAVRSRDFLEKIPDVYVRQFAEGWANMNYQKAERRMAGQSAVIREEEGTLRGSVTDLRGAAEEESERLVVPVTDKLPPGDTQLLSDKGGRRGFLKKIGWPWFRR